MPVNMKQLIADAFFGMAAQKSLDKITVKDLVEACGISRQTFYYHFQDIFEVIEWSLDQKIQSAIDRSLQAGSAENALRELLNVSKADRGLFMRMLRSQRREQVERLYLNGIHTYLKAIARKASPEVSRQYLNSEMALRFCAWGVAGLLIEACQQEDVDVDRFARDMAQLLTARRE